MTTKEQARRAAKVANVYAERAMTFCKQRGLKSGEFPVIDRDENPEQWQAWRGYFRDIGMRRTVTMMGERENVRWTVPAKWPDDFDPDRRIGAVA